MTQVMKRSSLFLKTLAEILLGYLHGNSPMRFNAMATTELDRDLRTGLSLVVDTSDPLRYYALDRRRRDLLTIGNAELARSRFAARVAIRTEELAVARARVGTFSTWSPSPAAAP
jgi:hypothetical protein